MRSVLRFKSANTPRQKNELARLKVVKGPDYGSLYVVVGSTVSLGRDETNDLVMTDLKASRNHATLTMTNLGWSAKDLKSANGITVNNKNVLTSKLLNGDTLGIGETVFEFILSTASTQMLAAPPSSLDQIRAKENAKVAHKDSIKRLVSFGGGVTSQSASQAPSSKRNRLVLVGALALAAVLFVDTDEKSSGGKGNPRKRPSGNEYRDLAAYLPRAGTPEVNRTADIFFKAGIREFREKNYLRARTQFETVLQVSPWHSLAKTYLDNSNKAIESEVGMHLSRARKKKEAGRYRESKGHYEAILRLLFHDQSNPSFQEAREDLEKLNKILKGEKVVPT